jgi:hypothetical protein
MLHVSLACILWGMAKISFLFFMHHMHIHRLWCVSCMCIPKTKKCVFVVRAMHYLHLWAKHDARNSCAAVRAISLGAAGMCYATPSHVL